MGPGGRSGQRRAGYSDGPRHQDFCSQCEAVGLWRSAKSCAENGASGVKRGGLEEFPGQRRADPSRPPRYTATTYVAVQVPEPEMVTPPPMLVERMVQVPLRTLPLAVGTPVPEKAIVTGT